MRIVTLDTSKCLIGIENMGTNDNTSKDKVSKNTVNITSKSQIVLDRTNWPKIRDYSNLSTYSVAVRRHYDVTNVNDIPIYSVYRNMKYRCYNTKCKDYHRYGGRGIVMSDSWRENFLYFFSDMGPRPTDEMYSDRSIWSLLRIDNDGNYVPNNCVWATTSEDNNNNSNKVIIIKSINTRSS